MRLSRMQRMGVLLAPLVICAELALAQSRSLVVLPAPSQPAKEPRVALVIGNSAYSAPLRNPVNDARAIADQLREVGFTVSLLEDASFEQMFEAVRVFGDELRKGGVGLFYFAGHGIQISGRNYLIPVASRIEREDEVVYRSLDAGQVLTKMATAGNRLNIVILDACRSNPFARSFRSITTGLAVMEAPSNTLIAFATSPGAVASDGSGAHGLYTEHLLKHIPTEGMRVEDLFKHVRAGVRADSAGRQLPWENTSLEVEFYFRPLPTQVKPEAGVAMPDPKAIELLFWNTIKASGDWLDFDAYLRKFPAGDFADLARIRLTALKPPPAPAAPQPVAMTPLPVEAKPPAPPPAPLVVQQPVNVFTAGEIASTAIAIAPNGGYAVSAARDGVLSIWDVMTTKELRRLYGHRGAVLAVAISPDSQFIASGGEDTTIRIWNFAGHTELRRLRADAVVTALAFAPNGRHLVSGHRNGAVYLWDMTTGTRQRQFAVPQAQILTASFSLNGRYIVAGAADGFVSVWDVGGAGSGARFGPHAFHVVAARMSADSGTVISASADGVVSAWDFATHARKRTLQVAVSDKAHAVLTLSDDGRNALIARDDGMSLLWDTDAGREIRRFSAAAAPVTALALSSQAHLALVAADGQKMRLWALKE